ncbi:MAG: hypothetical protein ACJ764_10105 [Solirubrobacteraceae bacterium]
MAENPTPSLLLGQSFPLPDGLRVRLRLARTTDVDTIAELFSRRGQPVNQDDLKAGRVVQFDPRRRYVLCATALIDSAERLVGVGAIDLDPHEVGEPDLLVFDPSVGAPVGELLWNALVSAAEVTSRDRAA